MSAFDLERALALFGVAIVETLCGRRLIALCLRDRLRIAAGIKVETHKPIAHWRKIMQVIAAFEGDLQGRFVHTVRDLLARGCGIERAVEIASDRTISEARVIEDHACKTR